MANQNKPLGDEISLEDLDQVAGGDGRQIGTYASVSYSMGVHSSTLTTYTDNNGQQFQASTSGWGLSMPGWGASGGNVYAKESAPADLSLRDAVSGPGWQGGFLDNTGIGEHSYSLETVGTPGIGLEHTNTEILTPMSPQEHINDSFSQLPNNGEMTPQQHIDDAFSQLPNANENHDPMTPQDHINDDFNQLGQNPDGAHPTEGQMFDNTPIAEQHDDFQSPAGDGAHPTNDQVFDNSPAMGDQAQNGFSNDTSFGPSTDHFDGGSTGHVDDQQPQVGNDYGDPSGGGSSYADAGHSDGGGGYSDGGGGYSDGGGSSYADAGGGGYDGGGGSDFA
jgi:hypothetical protein